MSKVCKAHAEKPAMIYGQCIGCELEMYQNIIKDLEKEISILKEEKK